MINCMGMGKFASSAFLKKKKGKKRETPTHSPSRPKNLKLSFITAKEPQHPFCFLGD